MNIIKHFTLNILKYDPYLYAQPEINTYYIPLIKKKIGLEMVLDFLIEFHDNIDLSFTFRRSCREGICGSCAINFNGFNSLACTHKIMWENVTKSISFNIFPLPHMTILKDLVVFMDTFFEQYKYIVPYLNQNIAFLKNIYFEINISRPIIENKQSISERLLLNNIYECILCACRSSSCPSYWWNKELYLGPAILLQAFRWIIDSRDDFLINRLKKLNDAYKIYRCHLILNCSEVCPKGLNPAMPITSIQLLIDKMI
jgi:succinate dehydrogenase/fumarate reductase iron-sulfur protein